MDKAFSGQACTQRSQPVQAWRSIARCELYRKMQFSGQAPTQAPQKWQMAKLTTTCLAAGLEL
jgi:hypothetical protein